MMKMPTQPESGAPGPLARGRSQPVAQDEEGAEPMPDAEQPEGEAGSMDMGKMQELHDLILARAQDILAKHPQELLTAMKADPVQAAVKFGVQAIRTVVSAAEKATGAQIPYEVIQAVAIDMLHMIAQIGVEKGLIPDEQLEPFVKESMQQGFIEYLRQDQAEGKITPDQIKQIKKKNFPLISR